MSTMDFKACGHHQHKLLLCDNLTVCMALANGRARDFRLLLLCRPAPGYTFVRSRPKSILHNKIRGCGSPQLCPASRAMAVDPIRGRRLLVS